MNSSASGLCAEHVRDPGHEIGTPLRPPRALCTRSIKSVFLTSGLRFRPPVRKPNHYAKINFLTSVAIFYVSPWGKKHSEPINTIEIYLNQFKLFVYLLFSSIRKHLKLKFYFGSVWGAMSVYQTRGYCIPNQFLF